MRLSQLIDINAARWEDATYDSHALALAHAVAERLCASQAKAIYQRIESVTGVPWFVVALIHEREASQSWKANIANGQPYDRCTTIAPKGRGPFADFVAAAIDALTHCPPYAARWTDYSAGGLLTLLELYNGSGYETLHIASPYLWAGSDRYVRGKYVSDGYFDPDAVDHQLGCAIMLKAMMEIDKTITLGTKNDMIVSEPIPSSTVSYQPQPSLASVTDKAIDEVGRLEALWKSKITWLTGGLGITAAGGAANGDQQLTSLLAHLMQRPAFWFAAGCVLIAAVAIYFHWRDHGARRHV
jgi:lysozyme family protein